MTVSARKKIRAKSRSRAKRFGTNSYAINALAVRRTIVSSVCRAGVAESAKLYEMSARAIPTPIAGKLRTSLPSHVSHRSKRFAKVFVSKSDGWKGHTAHAKMAPPSTMNGIPSHSRMLPLGRSMSSPTPAKVVRSARIASPLAPRVFTGRARVMESISILVEPSSALHIIIIAARYRTRHE